MKCELMKCKPCSAACFCETHDENRTGETANQHLSGSVNGCCLLKIYSFLTPSVDYESLLKMMTMDRNLGCHTRHHD